MSKLAKQAAQFSKRYRIDDGSRFRMKDRDPGDTAGIPSKESAKEVLAEGLELLTDLQAKLYAQNQWAVLTVFQGLDAAGKDGVIKHVMSGVDPQGCEVTAFKAPSEEELDHDFLWRSARRVPERGRIGIFNRSHYEEVLIARVRPEILERQRIPRALCTKSIWRDRFRDICNWERYLARNGVVILKFFLHVSKAEQKRRLLDRLNDPLKNWKMSSADARERQRWGEYMDAYEDVIRRTSTPWAPWFVVPADNKWVTRLVVAAAIVAALDDLDLAFPKVDAAKRKELAEARKVLAAEGKKKGRAR